MDDFDAEECCAAMREEIEWEKEQFKQDMIDEMWSD